MKDDELRRKVAKVLGWKTRKEEYDSEASTEEIADVAHIPDDKLRKELAIVNGVSERCAKLLDQYEGIEDGMTSLEPTDERVKAVIRRAKEVSESAIQEKLREQTQRADSAEAFNAARLTYPEIQGFIKAWTIATPDSYAQSDDREKALYELWVCLKQKIEEEIHRDREVSESADTARLEADES